MLCLQEEYYGKELVLADRDLVEQGADEILKDAKVTDVAFLVVGDPFGWVVPSSLYWLLRVGIWIVLESSSLMRPQSFCQSSSDFTSADFSPNHQIPLPVNDRLQSSRFETSECLLTFVHLSSHQTISCVFFIVPPQCKIISFHGCALISTLHLSETVTSQKDPWK